jgi:hypothetical protein
MGGNSYAGNRYCVNFKCIVNQLQTIQRDAGLGPATLGAFKCRQQGHLACEFPENNGNASQVYEPHIQNSAGQLNPFDHGK